ncbi:MAG: helix-turn-helix transcriptional regulator [Chloroflexota bacterium]|nr:helix-turn-helix transcriptional regulator [Dehalococcoidia bacterium]MDW8255215.1 helix-turn-helix transcriptional regulator [Chloroflexota bacterium]
MPEETAVAQLIRRRLQALGLSVRQTSLQANLSHNTLRVILAGARPTAETCDALEHVLGLPKATLRLLAGWPLPEECFHFSEEWARQLLELATPELRQKVIGFLLAQTPRSSPPGESA